MLKYVFLLCSLCILSSCLQKKDNVEKPKLPVKKEADYGNLYQYFYTNPRTLDQQEENKIIDYIAGQNLDAVRTRSGVYIVNHRVGEGDSIKWGDPIQVHYKGYFLDGKEFDSSYKRNKPIDFRVGSMVAGWNEALPFLKIGSKATFILPSHMGYGKKGFTGFVGPDEILLFDMDILASKKKSN
ncbi:MAG: FKBP-type peptidyl-prolyl cis-trans isomerase [Saprospiraceae bacterium]|nr:FKBP-type peptidyl-prolyl cis-trans isomerase [Saprospiraceae bacterium]